MAEIYESVFASIRRQESVERREKKTDSGRTGIPHNSVLSLETCARGRGDEPFHQNEFLQSRTKTTDNLPEKIIQTGERIQVDCGIQRRNPSFS